MPQGPKLIQGKIGNNIYSKDHEVWYVFLDEILDEDGHNIDHIWDCIDVIWASWSPETGIKFYLGNLKKPMNTHHFAIAGWDVMHPLAHIPYSVALCPPKKGIEQSLVFMKCDFIQDINQYSSDPVGFYNKKPVPFGVFMNKRLQDKII